MPASLFNDIIPTISYSDGEILHHILQLHHNGLSIDADFTYSKGRIYFDLDPYLRPAIRCDIRPGPTVQFADATNLEGYSSDSLGCTLLDPPFIWHDGPDGKMAARFGSYKTRAALLRVYKQMLAEQYRVLKKGGICIFKCMDTVHQGDNYFTHVDVCNLATAVGFRARDLFILLAKIRMVGHNHKDQQHARKYHSYYWVFYKPIRIHTKKRKRR